MRLGYTTGACAALAARAAVRLLLGGGAEADSTIVTPRGIPVTAAVLDPRLSPEEASCAVRKDAGDDPDVTDGVLVYAAVRKTDGGIRIDGGTGVGRVTRRGLDQPVGAAAINRVPREMIEREVKAACGEFGYGGGIGVVISIPEGERLAAKTFNPHLGVVGGLSVIGTSGIVEPMSTRALLDTMRVEMNVLRAEGVTNLVLTPGNYGENFLRSLPVLAGRPYVKFANYAGEAIDMAGAAGFGRVLVIGHAGKLVKLSGGVMDTHSRTADCRMELLALHAALAGAEKPLLEEILDANTVENGFDLLGELSGTVMECMVERAERYLARRAAGAFVVGVAMFGNRSGMLGISKNARDILALMEKENG